MKTKKLLMLTVLLSMGLMLSGLTFADDDCPVGLVSGVTLDDEFGPGTSDVTRCVNARKKVKVVYQINKECKNSACTAAYAIGNINNAIKDYEITAGMSKDDYEIVAIVHSGGAPLVIDNNVADAPLTNKFQMAMEGLVAKGVKVYFCQNTSRKKAVGLAHMIKGIEYVTAGVTAISDFQSMGYSYVQP